MTRKNRSTIKPLRVKLFASTREMTGGKKEIELEFEQKSVTFTDLKERILQAYPQMKSIPFVLAVNYKVVTEKEPIDIPISNTTTSNTIAITADDEIALLPPISGG